MFGIQRIQELEYKLNEANDKINGLLPNKNKILVKQNDNK